jgi:DNA modification methylase
MPAETQLLVVSRPLASLAPYVKNARTHSDTQVSEIAASISEYGFTNPVLVDETGSIIAGHGRVLAARKLGLEAVPTLTLVGLTEVQKRAYRLADNRFAEKAGWDTRLVLEELEALKKQAFDIALAGWSEDDLAAMLEAAKPTPEPTEDEVPDPPKDPVTKLGDVWLLGRHRLVCGDATAPGIWAQVLEPDARLDLVFTDPPYGVDYVGKTADALPVHNDDAAGLPTLLGSSFDALLAVCRPGAVWYVCASPKPSALAVFAEVLAARELWRQSIVWVKDQFVMGFADFHGQYEQIFYGWVKGTHRAPPDRKQSTVWSFDRPKRSEQHPTMKPVALVAHALGMSSARGERIGDAFLGSGTTLIVAEQLERTCCGIELSPAYCDVVVERYQNLTGTKATRRSG